MIRESLSKLAINSRSASPYLAQRNFPANKKFLEAENNSWRAGGAGHHSRLSLSPSQCPSFPSPPPPALFPLALFGSADRQRSIKQADQASAAKNRGASFRKNHLSGRAATPGPDAAPINIHTNYNLLPSITPAATPEVRVDFKGTTGL